MIFLLRLLFLSFFLLSNTFSHQDIHSILPAFEKSIQSSMEKWHAPGVAVVIVKDGQIIYEKGFGVLEIGKEKTINEHTVFPIASLTKNFLTTLIAQLVDEGKLKWDDLVIQYLPDFSLSDPDVTKKFTIRDLISHRSGLKAFSSDRVWYTGGNQTEIINSLSKQHFKTPFRQDYAYQNHLFGIAGLIVEKITGQTINDLFTKRFFEPLEMKDSSVGFEAVGQNKSWFGAMKEFFGLCVPKNVALPHYTVEDKVVSIPIPSQMYVFNGSTGINASIHDMSKWLLFNLNNCAVNGKQLVSKENCAELRKPSVAATKLKFDDLQFPGTRIRNVHYGMGWFLYEYGTNEKKVNVIGHMSGFSGVRGLTFLIPEHNLGVAILSNFGALRVSLMPEALRSTFLDLYLDLPKHDWDQEITQTMTNIRDENKQFMAKERQQDPRPCKDLKAYEGEFENEQYGKIKITLKNDKLWLTYRSREILLNHWNGDEFSFAGNDLALAYSGTDEGQIEFGFQKSRQKADVCLINLMYDSQEDLFKRV
jgi:CubicO group peptidase (beta-lactamase class C family)